MVKGERQSCHISITLLPALALKGCDHCGTLAEGWSGSLQLPVLSPSWESVGGDTASPQHVSGAGRTSWLVLAVLSGSHSSFSGQVLMVADGDSAGFLYRQLPFLSSLERKDGKATAYICSNFTCSLPVTSVQELRGMLSL